MYKKRKFEGDIQESVHRPRLPRAIPPHILDTKDIVTIMTKVDQMNDKLQNLEKENQQLKVILHQYYSKFGLPPHPLHNYTINK